MAPTKRKRFYGAVTVSERGQIVIPADARRDFAIKPGDKLLVFGDLEQGIALGTVKLLRKTMNGTMAFLREIGPVVGEPPSAEGG